MNIPDDIIHNILSYVDLYEDKRSKVFHQIKMNRLLTELKMRNKIYYNQVLFTPHISYYIDYLFFSYTDYRDTEYTRAELLEMIINDIPNEIMYIKSYLDNPHKKWTTPNPVYIGHYYSNNSFASHVEYMKKDEPNIINELLQLKSNYLYNFIDEYIHDTIQHIIN